MKWINQLFKNRKEKELINKMLVIAAHENMLERSDIDLLTSEMKFITYEELSRKQNKIQNFKQSLPKSGKEKFKVIFLLLSSMMKNGVISDSTEEVVSNLIQVMNVPKEKACELVSYLKSNIKNGLSLDDSYMRLGYLLDKSRHI